MNTENREAYDRMPVAELARIKAVTAEMADVKNWRAGQREHARNTRAYLIADLVIKAAGVAAIGFIGVQVL